MDIKQIEALCEILNKNALTLLEITEVDFSIKIEKSSGIAVQAPVVEVTPTAVHNEKELDFNDLNHIKSPMVGVFYSAPSPDAAPYVKIGDRVTKGDVLCIIEAMKLMNEIVADKDGEIVDICAENGQVVEFGQIIFKIF